MRLRRVRWLLLLFVAVNLVFALLGLTLHRRTPTLTVWFLDVGQGDSCVLESPSGKVLVVDTGGIFEDGGDDAGQRVVAPFLRHMGIHHIDTLVLTHPHADHIGGAATLLEHFPVGLLMDNGQEALSPVETHLLQTIRAYHVNYRAARRGQTLDFGDGVEARVLGPTEAETHGLPNDASVILRVTFGRTTFLLTGDAEAGEEADLLASGHPLAADVLKVGHHGSRTSTTSSFLTAVHPHLAVISVGAHNLYGHPSQEVLSRLHDAGMTTYRTDQNGAITCVSDGLSIHTESMTSP